MSSQKKQNVIIVGSGIFGMSTALFMLEDGGYNVLVLDKSGILPAPDAASTDLNKIVRAGDYADPHYAQLAVDAVELWRKPEWEGTYHETGVIALAAEDQAAGNEFVETAYRNCRNMNIEATLVKDVASIKKNFPRQVPTGSFGRRQGYLNPIGGWAEAARAVEVGHKRIRQLGGQIRGGAEVVGLIQDGKRIQGVVVQGGEQLYADIVVVAAGAWTPALFVTSGITSRLPPIQATGQTVATVQLTPEEAKKYASVPVVFNLDNGYYVFPPNPDGLVKMAIHAAGHVNPTKVDGKQVSIPRTKLTPGAEDGMIPLEKLQRLRKGLSEVYPELAKKNFASTRLCWYCDTATGDWLIDYHPDFDNLVIATGGSGHAFKYASVIGREILKVVQRKPNPAFAKRWSFDYDGSESGADVRSDQVKILKVNELATAEDLLASSDDSSFVRAKL